MAAMALLFAAAGCDYWNNLIEEPKPDRAELRVKVVDAWTGSPLEDAECRDSLRSQGMAGDGKGGFRILGATGSYAIRCGHDWYYDGAADLDLPKTGAQAVVKLARRGGEDWYRDFSAQVRIQDLPQKEVRFPGKLEWSAVPSDDSGRFRYEWTFRRAARLSHGYQAPGASLDSESYKPVFRTRASAEMGVEAGPDTVILKVYSLLNGKKHAYEVGSYSLAIEWIPNQKPFVSFKGAPATAKVGCGPAPARFKVVSGDSDGRCDTLRFWSKSPSLKIDTLLSCDEANSYIQRELIRPNQPGAPRADGSEEFQNMAYAEITDDNGQKARDSVTFLTYTNAPPWAEARILNRQATYFVGDSITLEIKGRDTDGGIEELGLDWQGTANPRKYSTTYLSPNFPLDSVMSYRMTHVFAEADTFKAFGRTMDNCKETDSREFPPLTVKLNTPPKISITELKTDSEGDTLQVQFRLTVNDQEAIENQDLITLVRIDWAGLATTTDTSKVKFLSRSLQWRRLPHPAPGTTLPITVHVEDSHFGGSSDTTFRVP